MLTMGTVCVAQKRKSDPKFKYNPYTGAYNNNLPICFLDTISIQDAILIGFKEKKPKSDRKLYVLVSKSTLDSNTGDSSDCISYLLSKDAYLWYSPSDFMMNVNAVKKVSPSIESFPYYSELLKFYEEDKNIEIVKYDTILTNYFDFEQKKDTIIPEIIVRKPKYYKGWESYDVIPKKFLLCLVKGSRIHEIQDVMDGISLEKIGNVYLRVLIPISW